MSAGINEKRRIVDVIFLSEIGEKHRRKLLILNWR